MSALPDTSCHARALVWFRRDLRNFDHAALHRALAQARAVHCVFVFDREILDALPRHDRRVEFIRESIVELAAALEKDGGGLIVLQGSARAAIPDLARRLDVGAVYANHDYEPDAIERDAAVAGALAAAGIEFLTSKDQVIFERDEVRPKTGAFYSVFTPYRNAWLARLTPADLEPHAVDCRMGTLVRPPREFSTAVPALEALGFDPTGLRALRIVPGMAGGSALFAGFRERIDRYRQARDFPALDGTSYLSVHLRFGTVSIRELVRFAHARSLEAGGDGAATWLSELIWRDFFAQILWHRPNVVTSSFRPEYADLAFGNDPARFAARRDGRTGYPLVDAAMRQLNSTGYMHNRLRMIAASFLVKDLLVDWRLGERYFARTLIDYDLASNNGGWQWAASTGCDAQPYFRIFNPVTQSQRFDAQGTFIRRYVPELAALDDADIHAPWQAGAATLAARGIVLGRDYPAPIVDHAAARAAALALYQRRGTPPVGPRTRP